EHAARADTARPNYVLRRSGLAHPSALAARPPEATSQALAQLERRVSHGPALPSFSGGGGAHRDDPSGGRSGRLELPHVPEPYPCDGACPRRQSAHHDTRRPPWRQCPPHTGRAPAHALVCAVAATSALLE